jgi:hypothetical protein
LVTAIVVLVMVRASPGQQLFLTNVAPCRNAGKRDSTAALKRRGDAAEVSVVLRRRRNMAAEKMVHNEHLA